MTEENAVGGGVKWVLRIEGLAIFILSIYGYSYQEFSWLTFFIFFLVPDISFLGYLVNSKVGAISYNFAHSLIGAAICFGLSIFYMNDMLSTISTIWFAHIGFDRALGYGLKYTKGFGYTHLGRIGKKMRNKFKNEYAASGTDAPSAPVCWALGI